MPLNRRRLALAAGIATLATSGLGAIGWNRNRGASARADAAASVGPNDAPYAARLINRTGFELLAHAAAREPKKNAVFAPGSIVVALTMAAAASSGQTRANLNAALADAPEPASDLDVVVERLGGLDRALRIPARDTEFSTAAALLADRTLSPNAAFLNSLETTLQTRARSVDFTAPATALELSRWISDNTFGLIRNAVSGFEPDTVVALATAVAFKGRWLHPFDPRQTRDAKFATADGRTTTLPMMATDEMDISYLDLGAVHAVRLPYRGGSFEIVLVLPKGAADTTISRWVARPGPQDWSLILDPGAYRVAKVFLELPRQQIETKSRLNDAVGASPIFAPLIGRKVELGRLTPGPLRIGEIRHDAIVRMDEQGTVAAAATVVGVIQMSARPLPIRFSVDRPHVFAIRHVPTGAVVFTGYVAEPKPAPSTTT